MSYFMGDLLYNVTNVNVNLPESDDEDEEEDEEPEEFYENTLKKDNEHQLTEL
jgi:hypothetical protein